MEEVRSLVVGAAAGDVADFKRLVGRFQHMACGCASTLLGDFHPAEEAAQEAFVDAYGGCTRRAPRGLSGLVPADRLQA